MMDIMLKVKAQVLHALKDYSKDKLDVSLKGKDDFLTKYDLLFSDIIKKEFLLQYPEICFFSEEDHDKLTFPAAIIDPIDGTKEFVHGIAECCLSIAYFHSDKIDNPLNFAWIFNPFTLFETSTEMTQTHQLQSPLPPQRILVSRSEWQKNLFPPSSIEHIYIPIGSIAYKLALLSKGIGDSVMSKRPKNIWDIAAGTLLCQRNGYSFYQKGKQVLSLNQLRYEPALSWCKNDAREALSLLET